MRSFRTIVDFHAAINNIESLIVAMGNKNGFPLQRCHAVKHFALLPTTSP
jgi:hypothetical protein